MSQQQPRPDRWWESAAGDDWSDHGPDVPPESLSGAMSDPISRYALSVPRIPRQRTGEQARPLRTPTLPAEAVELTFTQLIPKQYRPKQLDELQVRHDAPLEVSEATQVTQVTQSVEAPAREAATDPAKADPHHLRLLRAPAAVARKAARALKLGRRAA